MPIDEESVFQLDKDSKMPSSLNPMNNIRYSNNKFTKIDNNSSFSELNHIFPQTDISFLKSDNLTSMNNNHNYHHFPLSLLEQGISDLCVIDNQSNGISKTSLDEYRMRLASEEIRQPGRTNVYYRRTSNGSSDTITCSDGTCVGGISRGLSDPIGHSHQSWTSTDVVDENKVRDFCAMEAQKFGFIVGEELEVVKAKSHRSVIQNTPDRIINTFKDRYGQSDSSSKKTYLQLGVRVPSKEHVSEIVGKQGSKIKQIREKTGALITTPGEQEDHVFIIEAPPRTALHVAQILKNRAEDITMSRNQESRRRSSCPVANNNNRPTIKSPAISGITPTGSKTILASGRIQVPKIIVGRIIGTQGSIITTIQRDTGTEIRSPPKEIGKPKNSMADFEILVYQTTNLNDFHEAKQRVLNAKQLIAHIAMHQLEKIRAEEAPYSNYQVKTSTTHLASSSGDLSSDEDKYGSKMNKMSCQSEHNDSRSSLVIGNRDKVLSDQMKPHEWLWSDVDKLEDNLAQEVVNRILEESKKKTKTRSEPSIYDDNSKGLFTVGETESFSSLETTRPRHSLPETRASSHLDAFYRSDPQSNHRFSNDNYIVTDSDSDFHSSPNISFINRSELNSRQDISEHDILDFQSQDFVDNYSYHGSDFINEFYPSNQLPKSREITDPKLMQQLYLNGSELGNNVNSQILRDPQNRMFNRILIDQNYCNGGNFTKIDGVISQQNLPNSYFPLDNSHWNYNPSGFTSSNVNNSSQYGMMNGSIKSYADSVKPMLNDFSTNHGTIGDHLKKSVSNHFKA